MPHTKPSTSLFPFTSVGVGSALFAAAIAAPLAAQEAALPIGDPVVEIADDLRSFSPEYFATYAPQSALDMVQQIPGFEINYAEDRRGLGQGGANILLNGERLTGKTDPESQLARISADRVERIDILDGATLSIPGLSGQVANIQTKVVGMSGNWRWSPTFPRDNEPDWFNGEASLSGAVGKLDFVVRVKNNSQRVGGLGSENLRDSAGVLFETRSDLFQESYDRPGIGLDLKFEPIAGHTLNLNADYIELGFLGLVIDTQTPLSPFRQAQTERLDIVGKQWNRNVGLDYKFPLGSGDVKLVGYQGVQFQNPVRQFSVIREGGLVQRTEFDQASDKTETVVRSEYSLAPSGKQSWQIALEGAFNELAVDNQFSSSGPDGVLIAAPVNSFKVKEDRAEATLTNQRQLSPSLGLQLSIGAEYSRLSQDRDGSRFGDPRSFFRPKGFAAATYKYSPTLDIRARIERNVGQLNFFDFVSSTDLVNDLDVTANPDLVPEQSWLANLEFDKNLGQFGRLNAKFYGALISDIIDRIPIGETGEGVGNLDRAVRYGVDLAANLKGEPFAIPGLQLDLRLELRKSSLDDPLQGFSRRINSDKIAFYSADLRYDIPSTDWAVGAYSERFFRADQYRAFSSSQFRFGGPPLRAFIEHKDLAGMKARMQVAALPSRVLARTFYDGRRDLGQIERVETRTRRFRPFVSFELSGQF